MFAVAVFRAHLRLYFSNFFKIFFSRIGLIQNIKFFALQPHASETVLAAEAELAVFAIGAAADEIGKIAIVASETERKTFIAKLGAVGKGEIGGIFCAPYVLEVKTVFRFMRVKTGKAIFAADDELAGAVFGLREMRSPPRSF